MAIQMIKRGLKIRQVAAILTIPKSTLFYSSSSAEKNSHIAHLIEKIAFKRTFYGYRRIYLTLRKTMKINHKKVYRLYRMLNLQRAHKIRKNKGWNAAEIPLTEPLYPNHVWALDFLFDRTSDGRLIKLMPVEDIFSKFSPGINLRFRIQSICACEFLENLFKKYTPPEIIRTDQGPEFRSETFNKFLEKYRIKHEFTQKGSPWQNGHIESFIGKLRDECLQRNIFKNIHHAKILIEEYRMFYNTIRPHNSLKGCSPCEIYKRRKNYA
jgi:putative transposase